MPYSQLSILFTRRSVRKGDSYSTVAALEKKKKNKNKNKNKNKKKRKNKNKNKKPESNLSVFLISAFLSPQRREDPCWYDINTVDIFFLVVRGTSRLIPHMPFSLSVEPAENRLTLFFDFCSQKVVPRCVTEDNGRNKWNERRMTI